MERVKTELEGVLAAEAWISGGCDQGNCTGLGIRGLMEVLRVSGVYTVE